MKENVAVAVESSTVAPLQICYKSLRCEELELPEAFTEDHYTRIRNEGCLIFVTVNMFQTFRVIENVIEAHLAECMKRSHFKSGSVKFQLIIWFPFCVIFIEMKSCLT
jgi:hypothetical protein